jgi:hypothetical protein
VNPAGAPQSTRISGGVRGRHPPDNRVPRRRPVPFVEVLPVCSARNGTEGETDKAKGPLLAATAFAWRTLLQGELSKTSATALKILRAGDQVS